MWPSTLPYPTSRTSDPHREVATTKQVYLPRVLDGETMDFFAFAGWQELEQSGSFGIYEPRLEADGAVDPVDAGPPRHPRSGV